jgi:hypothetical protein
VITLLFRLRGLAGRLLAYLVRQPGSHRPASAPGEALSSRARDLRGDWCRQARPNGSKHPMPEAGPKRMPGGLASNINGGSKQRRRWKTGQGKPGPVTQCVAMQRIWCSATPRPRQRNTAGTRWVGSGDARCGIRSIGGTRSRSTVGEAAATAGLRWRASSARWARSSRLATVRSRPGRASLPALPSKQSGSKPKLRAAFVTCAAAIAGA